MRIHFELTSANGSMIATGSDSTQTIDLASWDNHSSVMRQLHTRGTPTRLGQTLTMWVEADQPMPIFPDETIDRATEAFHQAVDLYLDTVGSVRSRSRDWVDTPVPEVVEALLIHGWVPPADWDSEAGEVAEPESAGEGRRAVAVRRGVLTLCWSRGRRCMAEPDPPRRASVPASHTRIHAVLENSDQAVYLGSRDTDELDPHDPVNRGHVTALLRASGDRLDIHGVVSVYLEVEPLRVRAARFRLHRSGPGTDPILTDPVSTEPTSRLCECGLDLEPPEGTEYWRPDFHPEPGPDVYAVAICGESPAVRRAVRHEVGAGWREEGTNIHFPIPHLFARTCARWCRNITGWRGGCRRHGR